MNSAMALSASSSVCGANSVLSLRHAPAGPTTSSVRLVGVAGRRSNFASASSRRKSQWALASSDSDVNSTESKGKSTKTEESVPAWAQPGTDELPPWAKSDRPPTQEPTQDAPFFVYLIGSSLVAIAAVILHFRFLWSRIVFFCYFFAPFYSAHWKVIA